MADDRSIRAFLRALSDVEPKTARSAFIRKLAQGYFADCLESGLSCEGILELTRLFLDPDPIEDGLELCERKSLLDHLQYLKQIGSESELSAFLNRLAQALRAESIAQGITAEERLEFVSCVLGCYISYIKENAVSAPPSRNS